MSQSKDQRFTFYCHWQDALAKSEQEMPEGFQWWLFHLICLCIARHGDYGTNCYPGNSTIASEVRANVDTVRKYKQLIMYLGWFERTGKRKRRAEIINVAIPSRMSLDAIPADVLTLYGGKRSKPSKKLSASNGRNAADRQSDDADLTPFAFGDDETDPWANDAPVIPTEPKPSPKPSKKLSEPSRDTYDDAEPYEYEPESDPLDGLLAMPSDDPDDEPVSVPDTRVSWKDLIE